MALRVITPPAAGGLVPLADMLTHLRVDDDAPIDTDDNAVTAYIEAASDLIEAQTQRRYLPQQLAWDRLYLEDEMVLPVAPGGDCSNVSVDQVQYVDWNGDPQVLDPSLYWVRSAGATKAVVRRWFAVWPWVGDGPEPVTITFTIGPKTISACKLLTGHLWEHREAVVGVENRDSSTELPLGVAQLLFRERWY
jgi:uncharacterized phiE125 gp8 family phage protein